MEAAQLWGGVSAVTRNLAFKGRGYLKGRGKSTWTKHLLAGDDHCPTIRERGAGHNLEGAVASLSLSHTHSLSL